MPVIAAAARRVARTFVRAFSHDAPVVCPSGSCATMVAHYLPELPGAEPYEVWELSAFLDARGVEAAARNDGRRVAYHDSCHMLRELGIADAPRRLLERSGAQLVPLPRPDLCCGFGGTFSVRQPEISVAMADEKLAGARDAEALVTADPGCLMHLRGRAERTRGLPVVHLATALARGVRREPTCAGAGTLPRGRRSAALANAHTQEAADAADAAACSTGRIDAWAELPDVEALRERAHEIRMRTIDDLDRHLADFTAAFEARGGQVHFARDSRGGARVRRRRLPPGRREARRQVEVDGERGDPRSTTRSRRRGSVPWSPTSASTSSSSRGEHPMHIILPAIEKTAEDVAELFSRGRRAPVRARAGRARGRRAPPAPDVFLERGRRLTGANFARLETGSSVS